MRTTGRILSLMILCGAFLACEESLPSRDEPESYLSATLDTQQGFAVIQNGTPVGFGGAFLMTVRNQYDDVLSDSGSINGTLHVRMMSRPELSGTVHVSAANLLNSDIYRRGILTLGVDTAAILLTQWSHRTDAGVPFWSYVNLTPGVTPGGVPYLESDTVRYVIDGQVQIFRYREALVYSGATAKVVYRVFGEPGL